MTAWPESLIATHSGLRGRPAVDLTPDIAAQATRAVVALLRLRDLPPILAVASDGRPGGRALTEAVIAAATATGANVVDFGAVATPTAKLAAARRRLGGAIIVTGSHLGPDWNGLKIIVAPTYGPFDVRGLPEAAGRAAVAGTVERDDSAAAEHVAAVAAAVDAESIRRAGLKVQCSGGVGETATLAVEALGCETVVEAADVRLTLDADGDRLTLADEHGTALDPEAVLAFVAISRRPRHVVKGADTSRMVDDLVESWGGSVETVPTGELHLVEALVRSGGDLAGEGNGGVIVPAVGVARDALSATAAILELVARTSLPLSALAAQLPGYSRRRSTVPCATAEVARRALAGLAAEFGVSEPANSHYGLTIRATDGAWGLVRSSATEHVLRVTAEARSDAEADDLHTRLRAALEANG